MTIVLSSPSTAWGYNDLKENIALWTHRTDLTSQIPNFIKLAEVDINTDFRNRLMETDYTLTLTAGTRTIDLPDGYIEPIILELVLTGQDNEELTYVQPQQLSINTASTVACRPTHWTINADVIEFPNQANEDYTIAFRMLKEFDIEFDVTNSLLSNYPNAYLFASLYHAALYMRDAQLMQASHQSYETIKQKIKRKEGRSKALTSLRVDMPSTYSRSKIIAG